MAWPTPRFANNGDGTATDKLTGLDWLRDANCPAGTKTWQEALDWVDDLNTTAIACTDYAAMTFTDWRLPNVKELSSLIDYGESNPALPSPHPFVNVELSFYWSSSSGVSDPSLAWRVGLITGPVVGGGSKDLNAYVWPVRGDL